MKLGKTLYVTNRRQWRAWLAAHHEAASDIWLVFPRKHTGKPGIPYNDAVEEALCYGWIDSIVKSIDADKYAQRFSPRKAGSKISAMNLERIRRLIAQRKMTRAGLATLKGTRTPTIRGRLTIAPDIRNALQGNRAAWRHFRKFPGPYKRIRIGWIEAARNRPGMFKQRLQYFIQMTARNKKFGMVQ